MISLIIPIYRRVDLVKDSLMSLLYTLPDKSQIVIVDDGSPIEEISELREWLLTRSDNFDLILLNLPHTGNVSLARNRGAEVATGDLLVFMDSDVKVEQDWFSIVEKTINASNKIGCLGTPLFDTENSLYHTGNIFQSKLHRMLYLFKPMTLSNEIYPVDVVSNIFAIKKDIFFKVKFNEHIKIMGDETYLQLRLQELGYRSYVVPFTKAIHMKPSVHTIRGKLDQSINDRTKDIVMEGIIVQSYFLCSNEYLVFYAFYVFRMIAVAILFVFIGIFLGRAKVGLNRFSKTLQAIIESSIRVIMKKQESK